jgi:peptidoglycan/xylan/chitin deacetylase (PgdA/CDA1 family)
VGATVGPSPTLPPLTTAGEARDDALRFDRLRRTLGGIPADDTPQIVLLTFDDAINDLNRQLYVDLFENGRKNPNGCPISATFYVSHEWTDYSQVQNMYADGHELASHTIS